MLIPKDVVAASHASNPESESFHEIAQLAKRNVLKMPVQEATQQPAFHART
jgi:hypothetical protein